MIREALGLMVNQKRDLTEEQAAAILCSKARPWPACPNEAGLKPGLREE